VTGNNLANASTPGYQREVLRLAEQPTIEIGGLILGTGVDAKYIERMRSGTIEAAVTNNISSQSAIDQQLQIIRQLEIAFSTGNGALNNALDDFYNRLEALSVRPEDQVSRRAVIESGSDVTETLNHLSQELDRAVSEIDAEIYGAVAQVNRIIAELEPINKTIDSATQFNSSASEAISQRDRLLQELAQYVDPRIDPAAGRVSISGEMISIRPKGTAELKVGMDGTNLAVVTTGSVNYSAEFSGGKIAGLLEARNNTIGTLREQLDAIAGALIATIDTQHVMGVGLDGSFTHLLGSHHVDDTTVPLATLDTVIPIESGNLNINVIDDTTGQRTLHTIAVNANTDSLEDIAAAISGIDHLRAVATPKEGSFAIFAEGGYSFDFTGQTPKSPDVSLITGTSQPNVSGVFTGNVNDAWTLEFASDGLVGSTENLFLEVKGNQGNVINRVNVGAGYEADSPLDIGLGIHIELSPRTVVAGESFTVPVIAKSDTTGLLAAIGINTFFSGDMGSNLEVQKSVVDDPSNLAAARSNEVGDTTNLNAMVATRDQRFEDFPTQTLQQFVTEMISGIGQEVAELSRTRKIWLYWEPSSSLSERRCPE